MKTITKSLLLAVVMTMAAGTAFAQVTTLTRSFDVTAKVASTCRITTVAMANIAFGDYLPWDTAPKTGSTSLEVQCTRSTDATISWAGTASTGTTGEWEMAGVPGDALEYDLEFSYGTTPTVLLSGVVNNLSPLFAANSSAKRINVAGTLPAGQDVLAGDYLDTVTVTIAF